MKSSSKHWDEIFSKTEDAKLGWYEKDTSQTFKLLHEIPDWEKATIFLPGAGTSILIEDLISKGIKLILNDISNEALNRVGKDCKTVVKILFGFAKTSRNQSKSPYRKSTYGLIGPFCIF